MTQTDPVWTSGERKTVPAKPTPYFEARTKDKFERRILLVTFHFPPGVAAGALRWQKLVRFASERGWGVDVFTLDPECLTSPDWSRLNDLPSGVRVFGVQEPKWVQKLDSAFHTLWLVLRPTKSVRADSPNLVLTSSKAISRSRARRELRFLVASPSGWIRSYNVLIDFLRYGVWGWRAAKCAQKVFDPKIHRVVISSGPPHMAHEGARRLATATGLPLLIDMRDPWSELERYPEHLATPLSPALARLFERRAVKRAALVIANTEAAQAKISENYARFSHKIITVTNGYDDATPVQSVLPRRRFVIAYVGAIYIDRDPSVLFEAAAAVVNDLRLSPKQFGIEFVGPVDMGQSALQDLADRCGIGKFFTSRPPIPHSEVLQFLNTTSVLVNLHQDSHLAIPSKVFEYMTYPSWLLVLAEPGCATELLLRGTGADVVSPHDGDRIADVLKRRYLQFAAGEFPAALATHARFSRRYQAEVLFDRLNVILDDSKSTFSHSAPRLRID